MCAISKEAKDTALIIILNNYYGLLIREVSGECDLAYLPASL